MRQVSNGGGASGAAEDLDAGPGKPEGVHGRVAGPEAHGPHRGRPRHDEGQPRQLHPHRAQLGREVPHLRAAQQVELLAAGQSELLDGLSARGTWVHGHVPTETSSSSGFTQVVTT